MSREIDAAEDVAEDARGKALSRNNDVLYSIKEAEADLIRDFDS